MPTNLELKLKLKSHDSIKKILKNVKADYQGVLNQKDVYYKNKQSLLKLRIENGKECLIKYNRDEKGKKRWSDFDILYFEQGNVEKFLSELFKITAVVEKKRLLYKILNTRIHLDNVKGLGYFLELETLVFNNKKDAQNRFEKVKELLNLDTKNQIRKSYKDLILEKNKKK